MTGNGHVITSTPIAVDMWNVNNHPQAHVFFLSHFHGDHIVGLTSSWCHPIYTSPITSKFVIHKLKIRPSLVHVLNLNEDHIIPLDPDGHETMTVTLFDANHCPGSCMFLFSGYFGDILYTGDFRYVPDMADALPAAVDVLYLDNTYCSPACVLPTREAALNACLTQLDTCLVQCDRVFIGLDNLGKEDILERITKERQCKVHAYPNRRDLMEILGTASDLLTDNKAHTKIFVVPTNQISGNNLIKWNHECKTHAILATARFSGLKFKPFSNHSNIHVIPYSNHSSYIELKEFVRRVRPRSIVPIVSKQAKGIFGSDISDRADMSVFSSFLRDPSTSSDITIPDCVKRSMNDRESRHCAAIPSRKRKVARREPRTKQAARLKPGIRYVVSEDSGTDSDPEGVNLPTQTVWEITHLSGAGKRAVYYVRT